MSLVRTGRVLGAAMVWRSLEVGPAGKTLAHALVTGSEQERTMAGMALVQAGDRSVPHIEAEIRVVGASRTTVHVLADIGGPAALAVLLGIAQGSGPTAELAAERAAHLAPGDTG